MVERVEKKPALVWLLIAAGSLFLFAAINLIYPWLGLGRPSPEELESRALDTSLAANHRVEAALQLGEQGAAAQPHLRKLLASSQDSDVRAAAVQSLTQIGDWQDVPQLIDALDDPSPWVRGRAAQAVWRHMGTKFNFDPNAPPEDRAAAIKKIERHYKWQDDYRTFHHDAPGH